MRRRLLNNDLKAYAHSKGLRVIWCADLLDLDDLIDAKLHIDEFVQELNETGATDGFALADGGDEGLIILHVRRIVTKEQLH